MRFACISDLHLGDPRCALVRRAAPGAPLTLGDHYARLRERTGTNNDYLVLLGDVFDFAIQSYEEAYLAAKVFFDAVARDHLARDIVFVPGNHDGDFWHLLQYEVQVVKRIRQGLPPAPLAHAVAAVIDDRPDAAAPGLWLVPPAGDAINAATERRRPGRDGIFLDRIFLAPGQVATDASTPRFFVASPNLYLAARHGDTVLFTHGHYLQAAWAVASELTIDLVGDGLRDPALVDPPAAVAAHPLFGRYVPVGEMVAMNFPLNQLTCSGVGQAGALTPIVRVIQQEVQSPPDRKSMPHVRAWYTRAPDVLARALGLGSLGAGLLRVASRGLESWVMGKLAGVEDTKALADFLREPAVRERLGRYYLASMEELRGVNGREAYRGRPLPPPRKLVFGHTHAPIPWARRQTLADAAGGQSLECANTGGWLLSPDGRAPAEVVVYEDGELTSRAVDEPPRPIPVS